MKGDFETAGHTHPLKEDLSICDVANRRLAQIRHALTLEADHFERAHQAALLAADGSYDKILSDQIDRIVAALPQIADPLIRERVVNLATALASLSSP